MTTSSDSPVPPETARELLEHRPILLTSGRDRQVHARATAAFGLMQGAMTALVWGSASSAWSGILVWGAQMLWIVAIVSVATWRNERSATTPRHARRTTLVGIGASGVLMLAVLWPVHLGDASGVGPVAAVLVGGAVAAPALVAARRIRAEVRDERP